MHYPISIAKLFHLPNHLCWTRVDYCLGVQVPGPRALGLSEYQLGPRLVSNTILQNCQVVLVLLCSFPSEIHLISCIVLETALKSPVWKRKLNQNQKLFNITLTNVGQTVPLLFCSQLFMASYFFTETNWCNLNGAPTFTGAKDHNGRICLSHLDLFPTISPVSAWLTAHLQSHETSMWSKVNHRLC